MTRTLQNRLNRRALEPTNAPAPGMTDDEFSQMYDQGADLEPSGTSQVERAYEKNNNPDRLRVVDPQGTFFDVMVLGPNNIGVQYVPFAPDYAQPIDYYGSFDQVQQALDMVAPGWESHSGVNASSHTKAAAWVESSGSMGSALLILASAIIRLQ